MSQRGKPPAFQFYAKDWLADGAVRELNLAERGAYIDLLARAWAEGGIPTDPKRLGRLLGCSSREVAALWAALEPLFSVELEDGRRSNARLEEERAAQDEYRAASRARGRAGQSNFTAEERSARARRAAQERWRREKCEPPSHNDAACMRDDADSPSPTPTPSPEPDPPNPPAPRALSREADPATGSGDPGAAAAPPRGFEPVELLSREYPELDSPKTRRAVLDWQRYRQESGLRAWAPRTWRAQLNRARELGAQRWVEGVARSVANGWHGVFPDRDGRNGRLEARSWRNDPDLEIVAPDAWEGNERREAGS